MALIKYNETQIEDLKKNKYVKSITNKNINFSLECKLEALRLSNKWIYFRDIFKKLWFPEYIINSDIPKKAIDRWKRNKNKWELEKQKWRPRKEKIDFDNLTKDQYIEYLETKLAYYEEMKKYIDSWFS